MIKIDNVYKSYNNGKKFVINGISFEINDSESIAILGGNGAGKSTLLEIISGISEPDSGKVYFVNENNENNEDKEYLQKNIGIQFQNGVWPFNTKPKDLLSFFATSKWKDDEYIQEIIEVFEVKDILNKKINECSGGEQQRFNCLLSIINKPKVLILDELITGLDLKMQIKLIDFFKQLREKEKITLIIVSHIPEEVEQLSERIIILRNGKVYEDVKTEQVIKEWGTMRKRLKHFFHEENNETN